MQVSMKRALQQTLQIASYRDANDDRQPSHETPHLTILGFLNERTNDAESLSVVQNAAT